MAGQNMKLGIFDSGLGGIMIAKALRGALPDLDMVYLGDTLHVPYGKRSEKAIYAYTRACIEYLFSEKDCRLIIMACNTASASALRKLQQGYLPQAYPERRILGVVVPTIESALEHGYSRIGLIGTNYTVHSNVYREELQKINPAIEILQVNTPLLVPLIEDDGMAWMEDVLDHYILPLKEQGIEALVLSCTHYSCLKDLIRERYDLTVIAQDEILPEKLADYLMRHPEIDRVIGRKGEAEFLVTDLTPNYAHKASDFYGRTIDLQKIEVMSYGV
ncbi:MAG: glutamate racemase [Rhodospirillales bacterium]|nr:glutamate racemase [Rhodospirillales bacterium]